MFAYQKTARYFAQVAQSLEELSCRELAALGASDLSPVYRGIHFGADRATLYRINYLARLPVRILAPLLHFDCHSDRYLYKTAKNIGWETLFGKDDTFAISANVSNSRITHSQYASLCLKDAIADYFMELQGKRPDVKKQDPDIRLHLHIENNKATVYLDTSGGSLHRRGYRQETVAAPMQETLAAAIIQLTGWQGEQPLVDPMCGSGTLLAEALSHYCRIPAGYLRKRFGFEKMPDFDQDIWQEVKKDADSMMRPLPEGLIAGSDSSPEAISAARKNIKLLPGGKNIQLEVMAFQKSAGINDAVIVANPPYGIRIKNFDVAEVMSELGSFFKHSCKGSTAYLYFGDRQMLKMIGLKTSWRKPLMNGGLDGVLAKYELY